MAVVPNASIPESSGLGVFAEDLQEIQPSYSRYCMYRAKELGNTKDVTLKPHCRMCYTILTRDNYKVRLVPRMTLTKKLKKLLDRYASSATTATSSSVPHGLSRCQRKMVKRYLNSCNSLVISCSVCGKSSSLKCQTRSSRVKQLLAWKPHTEQEKEEGNPKMKKKKKKKTLSVSAIVDSSSVLSKYNSSNQQHSLSTDTSQSSGQKQPVGGPLITSTPIVPDDSGVADCSRSSKLDVSVIPGVQDSAKPSPVFALLGGHSLGDAGVKKKKKKGKQKHQHLEKLLQQQTLSENESKSGKKNSLASFLSELTY